MRSFEARLARLERYSRKRAKDGSKFDERCICYPTGRAPSLGFEILTMVAFSLKCPLHGDRFTIQTEVYVAKWLREKIYHLVLNPDCSWFSPQHRKAVMASFPPDLWPAQEEEEIENTREEQRIRTHLRLKDGTRIQVCQYYFPLPGFNRSEGPEDRRHSPRTHGPEENWTWERETLRIMAGYLSAKGGILDFSWLQKELRGDIEEIRRDAQKKGMVL